MASPSWPYNALSPITGTALVGDSNTTTASGTDDATALQALITNAVASGGVPAVVIPGRRTYRINSTITVPAGTVIQGIGGINGQGTAGGPCFVWGGTAGGTMFDCAVASQNNPSTIFDNIQIAGRSDGTALPATIMKFRGTGAFLGAIDTGTILRNVWFGDCSGNALSIEGGATNFLIEHGRFQNWGRGSTGTLKPGYAIYVTGPTGVAKSCNMTIDGNVTFTNPYTCNGTIFLDGEDDGANALRTVVKIYGPHPEFNTQSLNETFPAASGAVNPFDRCGLIRFGVNAAVTDVQHHMHVIGMQLDGPFGVASFSTFQITATSTADSNLDNTRMINLIVELGKGLSRGVTDASATNEIRILGGRVATAERPPQVMANVGRFQHSIGLNTTGGEVDNWINTRNFGMRGVGTPSTTFANLPTATARDGTRAYITDCNTATFNATAAGGGANKVPVIYDGANWKVG
jgi:hypothetical protein